MPYVAQAAPRTIPCATDSQGKPMLFNTSTNDGSDPHPFDCTITTTANADGSEEDVRIDRPVVDRSSFTYETIIFNPNDLITITADGCVQTAGGGATWKKYVNPQDKSGSPENQYFGTITIPGATSTKGPVENVSLNSLTIPGTNPPATIFIQKIPMYPGSSNINLTLGYTDDNYNDDGGNGYYDHDDGNNDQCANQNPNPPLGTYGGNAWISLHIVHDKTNPFSNVVPKEWDVVQNGLDANGLDFYPEWGWQVNGGLITNQGVYDKSCFPDCTSQTTSSDFPDFSFLGKLKNWLPNVCGDRTGLSGHRNWFDVTYTGHVFWVHHAGTYAGDDDYNMRLETTKLHRDPAGTSFYNGPSFEDGGLANILLEFDSDETIDHFDQSPYWQNLHQTVDDCFFFDCSNDSGAANIINGHDAVVLGLMGADEEHDGHIEIHPVHVLAIRENDPASPNLASDRWAFFARNWGDEGECSSSQHYLLTNKISLQLPPPMPFLVPPKATLNSGAQVFGNSADTTFGFYSGLEGTFLTFNLPAGNQQGFLFGEVDLNWNGQGMMRPRISSEPAAPRVLPRPVREVIPGDAEGLLADIGANMTAAQQQLAKDLVNMLRTPKPPIVTTLVTPQILGTPPQRPTSIPGVAQELATAKLDRDFAQTQAFCAATGGSLPTQPSWCPDLNNPPVTALSTIGGKPGLNGWLVSTVAAVLTAYDTVGTGVDHTEYSFDNVHWTRYSVPLTMPEGQTTLFFRSLGKNGLLEQTRQHLFKVDTIPPLVTGLPAPNFCTLWPPDHRLVTVGTETGLDKMPGSGVDPSSFTLGVTSNEPDSGTGPGDLPGDIVLTGLTIQLRAERADNGTGRIYTITGSVRDFAGNLGTCGVTCKVPLK
jgi:hypothetical protein